MNSLKTILSTIRFYLKTPLSTKGVSTATMDRRASPAGKSLVPLAREDARLDPFWTLTKKPVMFDELRLEWV